MTIHDGDDRLRVNCGRCGKPLMLSLEVLGDRRTIDCDECEKRLPSRERTSRPSGRSPSGSSHPLPAIKRYLFGWVTGGNPLARASLVSSADQTQAYDLPLGHPVVAYRCRSWQFRNSECQDSDTP